MRTVIFSLHKFERAYLEAANAGHHELRLLETPLSSHTAGLAEGCDAASIFVSDDASAPVLEKLHALGVRSLALRSAGFNHVDLEKAAALGMTVMRVPAYSPFSVAEHAVALMLSLNRKVIRAHNRIVEQNFLLDGLVGFDMNGKTAGIIGTGRIGSVVVKILSGFGCRILAVDPFPDRALAARYNVEYTNMEMLCRNSDIISLHVPLTNASRYMVDEQFVSRMKPHAMLINTGRGALVKTTAVIDGLKAGTIGYFGMDVYEEEEGLFFEDHSEDVLQDDLFARLTAFPNVIITGHQGFLTDTALKNIAAVTFHNLDCVENGTPSGNEVKA